MFQKKFLPLFLILVLLVCTLAVSAKQKADAPEVAVDGTVFSALDASLTYAIAPYCITGADTAKAFTFTGETSIDVLDKFDNAVGLYAFYRCGNGKTTQDSDVVAFIYVEGSEEARKNIVLNDEGKQNIYVVPGYNKAFGVGMWSVGELAVPGA